MNPAAGAILEGMPGPRDLRRDEHEGMTVICAGSGLLAGYPSGDAGMRNVAVAVLRQLGFGGRTVAAVVGLTEICVATLHSRARREGTPGLVCERGRPGRLAARDWEQAARWRAEGASDSEIARRLRGAQSTVFRRLGPAAVQEQLPGAGPEGEPAATGRRTAAGPQPEPQSAQPEPEGEPGPRPGSWPGSAGCPTRARCGPGWPRWPGRATRWPCSGSWPRRCWPPTPRACTCTTSMITSSPTRAPSRCRRAGTPSAATPSPAAPTPSPAPTAAGPWPSPPAPRPAFPP